MKSKKQPSTHIPDITRPKKVATTDAPAEPQLVIPKRSFIVPVSSADEDAPAPPEPTAAKPEGKSVQPTTAAVTSPEQEPAPDTKPGPQADADVAQAVEPNTTEEPLEPTENDADPKSGKPNPNVRKALEEAKREQEIEQFIENGDFFVPVNAVARKRTIKVSVGLVILELLLGLLLINLMLDAGVIELLDKIPHTHFFDVH